MPAEKLEEIVQAKLENSTSVAAPVRPRESKRLYLMHVSIHGLIRANAPEIGVDADTGGQTKYVLELSRRLGVSRRVRRFELLTRKIVDPQVSADYGLDIEPLAGQARIVRLPCGPPRYLAKELLWPHLQEFVDNALRYIRAQSELPDVIHGHYADGGFAATRIAKVLGIPLIYTAHSLGRFKRERILAEGLSVRRAESRFHFKERIEAEEETLENAALVIASTSDEVEHQYAKYDLYKKDTMCILPPGCEIEHLPVPVPAAVAQQQNELKRRFLASPNKPAIILLARPDSQKNIAAALHAFAQNGLREHANLILFIGLRDSLAVMNEAQRRIYLELLELVDLYDLYGSVAYPKRHSAEMVRALYKYAFRTGGMLLALSKHENFGLTLVEAAAAGVPVLSSGAGGMADVLKNCGHGLVVDPQEAELVASSVANCLMDKTLWQSLSKAGLKNVKRYYTWPRHIRNYLRCIDECPRPRSIAPCVKRRIKQFVTAKHYLVCDIDNTLTGHTKSLQTLSKLIDQRDDILFGIATGRSLESTQAMVDACGLPQPILVISAVGTRIHYNFGKLTEDIRWRHHIHFRWQPDKIRSLLAQLTWLQLQEAEAQSVDKISYYLLQSTPQAMQNIKSLLRQNELLGRVVVSQGRHVDILPVRASKGHALRYVSWRFGIEMSQFLTAGDSGNDIDMLRGVTRGIVVANCSAEVRSLRRSTDVYFSQFAHAAGVLDGLKHYRVF
jgi:sucrose-phosphate synthase